MCGSPSFNGEALRCGMTEGSSGGPWIQKFVPSTGLGQITSVNSFGCPSVAPFMMHGPYFGKEIKTLYDAIKNGK
jgi:hypothetical protein